jgi:hypothetical protein
MEDVFIYLGMPPRARGPDFYSFDSEPLPEAM